MSHFEMGEWVDFVRGLVTGEDRAAMELHLAGGCETCGATVRFLSRLAEAAAREQIYEATSAPLADAAKRAFRARTPVRRLARELRTFAGSLVYDSLFALHPAEARGGRPAARHLMYEAGQYVVDIRVDSAPASPGVIATGQIMDRESPKALLADLPVTLVRTSSQAIVAETVSDEFGEFVVEYTPQPGLKLRIAVVSVGDQVEVELQSLDEESNEDEVTE